MGDAGLGCLELPLPWIQRFSVMRLILIFFFFSPRCQCMSSPAPELDGVRHVLVLTYLGFVSIKIIANSSSTEPRQLSQTKEEGNCLFGYCWEVLVSMNRNLSFDMKVV